MLYRSRTLLFPVYFARSNWSVFTRALVILCHAPQRQPPSELRTCFGVATSRPGLDTRPSSSTETRLPTEEASVKSNTSRVQNTSANNASLTSCTPPGMSHGSNTMPKYVLPSGGSVGLPCNCRHNGTDRHTHHTTWAAPAVEDVEYCASKVQVQIIHGHKHGSNHARCPRVSATAPLPHHNPHVQKPGATKHRNTCKRGDWRARTE